jgi:hypothetical protein
MKAQEIFEIAQLLADVSEANRIQHQALTLRATRGTLLDVYDGLTISISKLTEARDIISRQLS